MNNLTLTQQGVKGNAPKYSANIGRIVAGTDNGVKIEIDAFSGFGDTYARREQHQITITSNDKPVFVGTAEELILKIQSALTA